MSLDLIKAFYKLLTYINKKKSKIVLFLSDIDLSITQE